MAVLDTNTVRVMELPFTLESVMAQVEPDSTLIGMTGGQWSVVDVVCSLAALQKWDRLTILSWRVSRIDLREALNEVRAGRIGSLQMVLDKGGMPVDPVEFQACLDVLGKSGREQVRVIRNHVKGFLMESDAGHVLYLTSANFNRNPRNENFELRWGGPLPDAYLDLIERVFAAQKPGAWRSRNEPRLATDRVLRQLRFEVKEELRSKGDKARDKSPVAPGDADDEELYVSLADVLAAHARFLNRPGAPPVTMPDLFEFEEEVRGNETSQLGPAPGKAG